MKLKDETEKTKRLPLLQVRLEEAVLYQIRRQAKIERRTVTEVTRNAVLEYLAREEEK